MNKLARYAPWLIVIASLLWATDAPFRKFLTGDLPATLIVLSEHIIFFFFFFANFFQAFGGNKKVKIQRLAGGGICWSRRFSSGDRIFHTGLPLRQSIGSHPAAESPAVYRDSFGRLAAERNIA